MYMRPPFHSVLTRRSCVLKAYFGRSLRLDLVVSDSKVYVSLYILYSLAVMIHWPPTKPSLADSLPIALLHLCLRPVSNKIKQSNTFSPWSAIQEDRIRKHRRLWPSPQSILSLVTALSNIGSRMRLMTLRRIDIMRACSHRP